MLVYVDNENNLSVIQDLNKIAFTNGFTILLAWSNLECARYLETLKSYEGKSSTSIQEKVETEFLPKLTSILVQIRPINKTDVSTLLDAFGNFSSICAASEKNLILCPGIGDKKVKRLYSILHEPFIAKKHNRASNGSIHP